MKKVYIKTLLVIIAVLGFTAHSVAQEAAIGDVTYPTLAEAFDAAVTGDRIILLKDVAVSGMIPVTESVTLDLDGKTITNNVSEERLFRLSGVTFTIEGNGGSIINGKDNDLSWGFVDFRDSSGTASPSARLVASNVSFTGGTDGASMFKFRTGGQSIDFTDVDANLTESDTYSIINGYALSVDIKIKGGNFICRSTNATAGVFQTGFNSTVSFDGVSVDTTVGPIFEIMKTNAEFKDCTMKNTATNSYFVACVAVSSGGYVKVSGGTYESICPLYVYNSGGTIDVDGGVFTGTNAVLKSDNKEGAEYSSAINVASGEFHGPVSVSSNSTLSLTGGKYSADIAAYCASGYKVVDISEDDLVYEVVRDETTGVDGVMTSSEDAGCKVYNLQGICVGDSLDGLGKGLYIIAGRKVLVK